MKSLRRLRLFSVLLVAAVALSTGCQGRSTIPSGANMVQSGRGGLSYTADRAGDVYVLDADNDEKVFQGHMNHGDQLVVNPTEDRIVLGGNSAPHNVGLKPDHRYEIYFTPQ